MFSSYFYIENVSVKQEKREMNMKNLPGPNRHRFGCLLAVAVTVVGFKLLGVESLFWHRSLIVTELHPRILKIYVKQKKKKNEDGKTYLVQIAFCMRGDSCETHLCRLLA